MIKMLTLKTYFLLNLIKIEAYMEPINVYCLRFKLEVFIWRHWRHVV